MFQNIAFEMVQRGELDTYIAVLSTFFEENPDGIPDADYLGEMLKKKMKGI